MRVLRIIILAAVLAALTAGTAFAGSSGNSDAAHACQKGGFATLVGSGGETFGNVGECVSFAVHGGTFGEPPPPPPTGIVVPAGATVTFDNPTLGACNQLSWGFEINVGMAVVGGKPYGCLPAEIEPDSTFGPFATTTTLRVFLTDHTCGSTNYFNDGDHGITTPSGPNTWDVDVADGGGFCERQSTPAVFVPPGNLSVDVVVNP